MNEERLRLLEEWYDNYSNTSVEGHIKELITEIRRLNRGFQTHQDDLNTCKYCEAKFIPSLTATLKDTCHACIMDNL